MNEKLSNIELVVDIPDNSLEKMLSQLYGDDRDYTGEKEFYPKRFDEEKLDQHVSYYGTEFSQEQEEFKDVYSSLQNANEGWILIMNRSQFSENYSRGGISEDDKKALDTLSYWYMIYMYHKRETNQFDGNFQEYFSKLAKIFNYIKKIGKPETQEDGRFVVNLSRVASKNRENLTRRNF